MTSKFEEKEKQLSKVHTITYNEFENSLTSSMIFILKEILQQVLVLIQLLKISSHIKNVEEHFD